MLPFPYSETIQSEINQKIMAVDVLQYRYRVFVVLFVHALNPIFAEQTSANLNTSWTNKYGIEGTLTFSDSSIIRPIFSLKKLSQPDLSFGFLRNSSFDIFYLSIVKILQEEQHNALPPVIIWTASAISPVQENATLELTGDGDLILNDGDGNPVWSTKTSGRNVTSMYLGGDGNLKLVDANNHTKWQSFDHPTNTWLPGQPLKFGTILNSTVTSSDLSPGKFFLNVSQKRLNLFFNPIAPQNYHSIGYAEKFGIVFDVSGNHVKFERNGTSFPYLRLEPNGHFDLYDGHTSNFDLARDNHYRDCIYPTKCGTYGVCSDDECSCPKESNGSSTYFRQNSDGGNGFSCAEVTPLTCQDLKSHVLLKLESVTYFHFVRHIMNTSVESCKAACLRNCSCKAAVFRYFGDLSVGNCSLPTELYTLMNTTVPLSLFNASTFIKVQMPSDITVQTPSDKKKTPMVLLLAVSVSAASVLVSTVGGCYFYMRWRKTKIVKGVIRRKDDCFDDSSFPITNIPRKFSLESLISATQDFQVKLGRGGFGSVFEGILENGTKVAVKRLGSDVNQGQKEFLSEVKTIGSIHHFNLVRLVGYCAERSNRLLVYEYMCNGSLDKWIFHQNEAKTLSWETRKKIIVQIAKGLEYLHNYCNPNIIHFDIKPQNFLLDEDMNVKISDFGLASLIARNQNHISTMPKGTPGYIAPELIRGKNITMKIDIYSFGVVILEIICGRRNSNSQGGDYLIDTLKLKAEEDKLSDLVDEQSEDMQNHKEDAIKMIEVAISCLQTNLDKRPSASVLVKVFEGLSNLESIASPGDLSSIRDSLLSGPR